MKRSTLAIPTAAACMALLLSGCTNGSADAQGGGSAAASAPTTSDTSAAVAGYFAGSDPRVPVSYTVPDGWEVNQDPFMVFGEASTVNFWDVGDVYAEGCRWNLLDPPLGPSVDDLATVWAELPGFTATTPVDITIGGYAGQRVDYTLPDYDEADCLAGKFGLWKEDGTHGGPNFWAQVPKQQNRQWIIDVDGTRLVINEWSQPGTTPEQLADMDQFLASIQIG